MELERISLKILQTVQRARGRNVRAPPLLVPSSVVREIQRSRDSITGGVRTDLPDAYPGRP